MCLVARTKVSHAIASRQRLVALFAIAVVVGFAGGLTARTVQGSHVDNPNHGWFEGCGYTTEGRFNQAQGWSLTMSLTSLCSNYGANNEVFNRGWFKTVPTGTWINIPSGWQPCCLVSVSGPAATDNVYSYAQIGWPLQEPPFMVMSPTIEAHNSTGGD
jgi:hypothetical protein